MNENIITDFLYDVFCIKPLAEFRAILRKKESRLLVHEFCIFKIFFSHIAQIFIHVHQIMISKNKMHLSTCFFCLFFQGINQPKRLRYEKPSIKEISHRYKMSFPKSPFVILIHHLIIDKKFFKLLKIPFNIRNGNQFFRHRIDRRFFFQLLFQPERNEILIRNVGFQLLIFFIPFINWRRNAIFFLNTLHDRPT